jgi:hypothetical protein
MKGKIAALIVGLVLGSTGVAFGSSSIAPWHHTAPSYTCHGYTGAGFCRLRYTPYESFVSRGEIDLVYGGHVFFQCKSGHDPVYNCQDFR